MKEEDIERYLEQRAKAIDRLIEKYIPRKYDKRWLEYTCQKAEYEYSPEAITKTVAEPMWDLLDRGGKRWRPVVFSLVCEALGGDSKKYEDLMVLIEVIHNGSLIADDIEDSSKMRRGEACTYQKFGVDIAVNASSAMYYIPLLILLKSRWDEKTKLGLYDVYAQEMINIHFGQGTDIAWHNGIANSDSISEGEYFQMCSMKTGTLARMAGKIGAIVAGKKKKTVDKVGRFSESLGVAFQIQDDLLDLVTVQRDRFGKMPGNDIMEGKRTLMVIHALNKAQKEDKERLLKILNSHTDNRVIVMEAINIMNKYDSIEYAKKVASSMIQKSWDDVKSLFLEGEAKEKLRQIVEFSINRQY